MFIWQRLQDRKVLPTEKLTPSSYKYCTTSYSGARKICYLNRWSLRTSSGMTLQLLCSLHHLARTGAVCTDIHTGSHVLSLPSRWALGRNGCSEDVPILAAASVWSLITSLGAQLWWRHGRRHQVRSLPPSPSTSRYHCLCPSQLGAVCFFSFVPWGNDFLPHKEFFCWWFDSKYHGEWCLFTWTLCQFPDQTSFKVLCLQPFDQWTTPSHPISLGLTLESIWLAWEIHVLPQNPEVYRRGYVT